MFRCWTMMSMSSNSKSKKMNFESWFPCVISLLCSVFLIILCPSVSSANSQPPNIVIILADDLGWDDVGFHGSEIKTPNIDRLAGEGIILNNYYVSPVCTPTRGSILTGRYPIHTGLQSGVPMGTEPWGLPLNFTTLPQALKQYGYTSHAVGKWHLGFFSDAYLPENRGFKSFFGYYNGNSDYLDHHFQFGGGMMGLDFHYQQQPMWNYSEVYSTDIFTNRAISIIESHDKSTPLFLYLPHQAVHAGTSNDVIQAPQKYVDRFPYITDIPRRYFAGAVSALDDSVGHVYQSLVDAGMANNTVIIFSTDNGGPTNGRERNAACNWPLRGSKVTLWQGGVRGVGFIHSPLLRTSGYVSDHLMHATDWFPTVLSLASNKSSPRPVEQKNRNEDIDGIDQWAALSFNTSTKRKEVLVNIDPREKSEAIIVGDFKLTKGEAGAGKYDEWYPPPKHENPSVQTPVNRDCGKPPCQDNRKEPQGEMKPSSHLPQNIVKMTIDRERVTDEDLDKLISWMNVEYSKLDLIPKSESDFLSFSKERPQGSFSMKEMTKSGRIVKVDCGPKPANASANCDLRKEACLFNIKADPCEYMNLNHLLPHVLAALETRMNFYRDTMVPPAIKGPDPKGDPALHGGVWRPWL